MDIIKTSAALSNIKTSLEHVNKCKKLYQQKHKELIESEESLTKAGLAADKTEKVRCRFSECYNANNVNKLFYSKRSVWVSLGNSMYNSYLCTTCFLNSTNSHIFQ